jgi:hypothetical protein
MQGGRDRVRHADRRLKKSVAGKTPPPTKIAARRSHEMEIAGRPADLKIGRTRQPKLISPRVCGGDEL